MKQLLAIFMLFFSLSTKAGAEASFGADAGATYVSTRTEGRLADCEGELIDRRLSAGVSPTWKSRRGTLAGRGTALALVQPEGSPEVFDTSGSISLTTRTGEHQLELSAGAGYQNQLLRFGCGSSLDSRLERARSQRQGTMVAGDGLRTRSASATHTIGHGATIWATKYSVMTSEAAESDTRHDLSLNLARKFSRVLGGFVGVRVGAVDGDLDEFADTGAFLGGAYQPTRRLSLSFQSSGAIRDDGGRTIGNSGGARYSLTRQVQTYGQASSSRGIRVRHSSTLGGELGVQVSPPRTTMGAAAHYVEIDNELSSVGKWYTASASRALTPRQSVGGSVSTGAPYPEQSKQVTSWSAQYNLRLDKLTKSWERGGGLGMPTLSSGALSLSYSVSRVISLADDEGRLRQWSASMTASF